MAVVAPVSGNVVEVAQVPVSAERNLLEPVTIQAGVVEAVPIAVEETELAPGKTKAKVIKQTVEPTVIESGYKVATRMENIAMSTVITAQPAIMMTGSQSLSPSMRMLSPTSMLSATPTTRSVAPRSPTKTGTITKTMGTMQIGTASIGSNMYTAPATKVVQSSKVQQKVVKGPTLQQSLPRTGARSYAQVAQQGAQVRSVSPQVVKTGTIVGSQKIQAPALKTGTIVGSQKISVSQNLTSAVRTVSPQSRSLQGAIGTRTISGLSAGTSVVAPRGVRQSVPTATVVTPIKSGSRGTSRVGSPKMSPMSGPIVTQMQSVPQFPMLPASSVGTVI